MQTEQVTTQPKWTSLSGRVLPGGYELQDLIEADSGRARFKVRVLGDRDLDALGVVLRLPDAEIAGQVEIWELARHIRHANLSAPLGAGHLELDGAGLAYAILRRADEALDGVLRERALTVSETGEVLFSVSKALEVLHVNDLVHGCLSPEQVLAVGDFIQLPTETLRRLRAPLQASSMMAKYKAPESEHDNVTPESDIFCLGATLFEALSRKCWTEESREEIHALPEPFASVAFRCLEPSPENRAKLPELIALYRGELKLAPRVRAAAVGATQPLIVSRIHTAPAPTADKPEDLLGTPEKTEVPIPSSDRQDVAAVEAEVAAEASASEIESLSDASLAAAVTAGATGRVPDVPLPGPQTPAVDSATKPGVETGAEANLAQARPYIVSGARSDSPSLGRLKQRHPAVKEPAASKLWLWAALGLLAVVGLIWALRPMPVATTSLPAKQDSASTAKPAPRREAWETRTLQPDGTSKPEATAGAKATAAAPLKPLASAAGPVSKSSRSSSGSQAKAISGVPASSEVGATGGEVWRVILFTFNHSGDAQNKAKSLNARHPDLKADVFAPNGASGPYLVTAGGTMTRSDATEFRRKAVSTGMPRDTYIQNYRR